VLAGAARRFRAGQRALAALLGGWIVVTVVGGLLPALALERLTRALPDGSLALTFPGGAVALDAFVQGRDTLSTALSTAIGAALAWGILLEPFLRSALLCSFASCGGSCPAQRGVLARGAKHFFRVFVVQLAYWAALVPAAYLMLLSGIPAWLVLPGVWLGLSLLADVAAVSQIASPRVRDGLRLTAASLGRRPLALLLGGAGLRLTALVPLVGLGLALASGPSDSPLRPFVLVVLPMTTLTLRAWWWAVATELVDRVRRASRGEPASRSAGPW
jgi:hypothetical protein